MAEFGHFPNRVYVSQAGNIHLNGAKLFDANEVDQAGNLGGGGNTVQGVAAAYKVARGVHQQAAASDTIVTGLATVVAVIVQFRDAPTANIVLCAATIGDQAGAPAAGSFLLNVYKTASSPVPATTFSDNVNFNWICLGT